MGAFRFDAVTVAARRILEIEASNSGILSGTTARAWMVVYGHQKPLLKVR